MQREYLETIFAQALEKIGITELVRIQFETPKNPDHGDVSTNIAMQLAKSLKLPPFQIAKNIIDSLEHDGNYIEHTSIAGAGFINVKFKPEFYPMLLSEIVKQKEEYGRNTRGKGLKADVEYVSVNPTGLLHLGHGRNACIGDTIANIYEWNGWNVTREYYFNNAGNQMQNLAKSIYARYMQEFFDKDYQFPEDGYHGDYIVEIAQNLYTEFGDKLKEGTFEDIQVIRKYGEEWCFIKIKSTLNRMNIKQDVYYNEDSLYTEDKIADLLNEFEEKGLSYKKDGAVWLSLSQMGLEDDRVIVKSSGEPTYRLPDIAYHREKFKRGFDLMIDVFGADHIATAPDVLAGVKSLGYDKDKIRIVMHQFVTLTENGQQVKMSKRTGKSYTLDDLLDEVGEDVVRFFLIMRGVTTHLEFDLSLAREQSEKNPVFYLQYAYARICSIFDTAKERGIIIDQDPDLSVLVHEKETILIKRLLEFPNYVEAAAIKCEPHVITDYLRETAAAFHAFYHECRIIGAEPNIMNARFKLTKAAKTVIKNGLTIIGVKAPERM